MTPPLNKLGKTIGILVWVSALAVLVENVALFRQNRRLLDAAAPQIVAGTQLRMLSGLALDGHVEAINLPTAGSKLLIVTFSPECPTCQANQEAWTKLADILRQHGMRVLWVSRDPIDTTKDYCLTHGIPFSEILADPPYRTYVQLGLARVPNTLLVGAGGKVEKVWLGRLDPSAWNSIFAYFGEQQGASGIGSELNAQTATCGPEVPDTPSKRCE